MIRKNGILAALVCSLLLGSVSARTPYGTKIRAGGRADSTVKAGKVDLLSDRENSESDRFTGEWQHQQQQHASPPSFYRALSRRSVGRYIMATSSLVGECARVYTPPPLSLVASSLWNRFGMGFDSHGQDRRSSLGHKKSSGFSYDRFMSPNDRAGDDEDLPGDAVQSVPPKKYGRVSSAFLVRHEIGDTAGLERGEEKLDDGKTKTDPVPPRPVLDDMPELERGMIRTNRRQSPQTTTGSVLKSITSLGRDRNKQAMDDIDLLSDSEDEADGCYGEREEGGRFGEGSTKNYVSDSPFGGAQSGRGSAESTIGRNLVDADDNAVTLVNRLRLGKRTGGESSLSSRRKARRSRQLDEL